MASLSTTAVRSGKPNGSAVGLSPTVDRLQLLRDNSPATGGAPPAVGRWVCSSSRKPCGRFWSDAAKPGPSTRGAPPVTTNRMGCCRRRGARGRPRSRSRVSGSPRVRPQVPGSRSGEAGRSPTCPSSASRAGRSAPRQLPAPEGRGMPGLLRPPYGRSTRIPRPPGRIATCARFQVCQCTRPCGAAVAEPTTIAGHRQRRRAAGPRSPGTRREPRPRAGRGRRRGSRRIAIRATGRERGPAPAPARAGKRGRDGLRAATSRATPSAKRKTPESTSSFIATCTRGSNGVRCCGIRRTRSRTGSRGPFKESRRRNDPGPADEDRLPRDPGHDDGRDHRGEATRTSGRRGRAAAMASGEEREHASQRPTRLLETQPRHRHDDERGRADRRRSGRARGTRHRVARRSAARSAMMVSLTHDSNRHAPPWRRRSAGSGAAGASGEALRSTWRARRDGASRERALEQTVYE